MRCTIKANESYINANMKATDTNIRAKLQAEINAEMKAPAAIRADVNAE
jgi:hypothetical protein